jgi:hypothetical protein
MPERRVNVRTVRIDYDCDECGEPQVSMGSGFSAGMTPTVWKHQCKNFHPLAVEGHTYPKIVYELYE